MIAGHAFVAFALGASGAAWLGVDRNRALAFGVVAGAFAVVPDVDMLYAVVGLLQADAADVWAATAAFWDSSRAVHRAMTHSLVLAGPAAVGFALAAGSRRRTRAIAVVPLIGLVALGWAVDGMLAASVLLAFALAGVAVALGATRVGFGSRSVLPAALVGLLTHPFGDLFTGTPPPLFFPLGSEVFGGRVVLAADPTLNLLGVFGLELGAIWLGVAVAARIGRWSIVDLVDRRAIVGALYGLTVFVLPPPTLDASYQFVFSVLAVGTVGMVPVVARLDRRTVVAGAVTGLAAVSLAGTAYAVAYVVA